MAGGCGGGGRGFLTSPAAWIPVQAAWAGGEPEVSRRETGVDPDSPRRTLCPCGLQGAPLSGEGGPGTSQALAPLTSLRSLTVAPNYR